MQSAPFVSIVLFCYNAEKFLRKAIDSLLQQSYQHFELIIIEDCSTDGSMSIVGSYTDPRIVLICNEQNSGIAFNRQLALSVAKGKYIFWMDNDDIAATDRIVKQVDCFEQHPEVVLCGTSAVIINEHDEQLREITYPATDEAIKAGMFFGFPFMSPSVGIRMAAVKPAHVEALSLVNQADDYTLYSMLMDTGSFVNLPDKLYYYREHTDPNRITTNPARGADIVAGRKVAWNIQLTAKGLRADDAVLSLHDKLTYYPQLISLADLQHTKAYLTLLLELYQRSAQLSIAHKRIIKQHISRSIANLLLAELPFSDRIQYQLRFASWLSFKQHAKIALKQILRKIA
ncbi:MAG: glycosyltransferase family 2 protein [Bacteroidetes bacterium]|uniref:glycosyltransferase family 2 protein n=1 Tax=Phnomibacter sp. TaxID=2836217 RepID=UPI002FDC8714|nr:glycosyltransferase family 2 protein [Bacteroidota bacterium]